MTVVSDNQIKVQICENRSHFLMPHGVSSTQSNRSPESESVLVTAFISITL